MPWILAGGTFIVGTVASLGAASAISQLSEAQEVGASRVASRAIVDGLLSDVLPMEEAARSVAAFIEAHDGELMPDMTNKFLADLLVEHRGQWRYLSVAPDNRVEVVQPVAGNEAVIGVQLEDRPDLWPEIEQAVQTGNPTIQGPVYLADGGMGVVYRQPILIDDAYWGLASVFLNDPQLISLSDPMATIESAAVVEAGTETVVFGDRDLDAADPHAVRLAIPVKAADWELLYIVGDIENAGFAVAVIGTLVSFLVALVVLLLTRGRIRAREMSARLSLVADEAPSVLFEYEVDEGGRVRTLLVSSAVRGLLGMTQEEAMEQGILSPIPATERLAIDDAVRVEAPWRVQFLFQGESGQQRWLLAQGAPSGTGAAQGLWRGSITDVTAEVERENAALREAEDERDLAEARTQSQREFLALMSHELRTPLNAVIGFQHLLGETDLNDRQQGLLRRSNEAADLLMATIADVLDFSKTEADALELESVASNVGVILAEVCSVTQVLAEQRGLELRRIDAPDLPPAIMTDPTRLRQLLLNLMGNAVKFTEVGYVQIATSRVTLDGGLPGLRFEVSDSGIGIDPERLAHIFEPFRQADASTSRRFGGTGLGLAISRRIAEAMGGGIHVLSEAEGGTTFTVEIAAKPATGALPGRQSDVGSSSIVGADATPLRLDGVRLLVAEDNEFNGEIVVDVLQAVGAEVELVTDGQQAVRKVRENSYDVIVLDVQMPVMDGLTAARVMLQTGLSGSTPIVALTANALAEDRALCLEAGMSDIVVKPVDPPVLVRALRKIISRSYEGASH